MVRTVYSVVRIPCRCKKRDLLSPAQRHCMACGGRNPQFSMEAYRKDNPSLPFGSDCRHNHRDLLGAIKEFDPQEFEDNFACCEHCGYNILTGRPATKKAPT